MDLNLATLLTMARDTVADPREGARRVMSLGLPVQTGWIAVALMAVASALFTHVTFLMSPPDVRGYFADMMASPLRTAFLQGVVMVAAVFAIWRIGRMRGGRGTLPQTVVLVAWLQFVLLVLQVVQLAVQVMIPPLAPLIGLAAVGLFFWLLTLFVVELHGFRSAIVTFLGIFGVMMVIAFVLALLLAPVPGPGT
jgi:Yip1 domain